MILQSLLHYYEALLPSGKVPPPGYSFETVAFALSLSPSGAILAVEPLAVPVKLNEKKTVDRNPLLQVPEQGVRSSGISAKFLCDNASYLLCLPPDKPRKNERTVDCFSASVQLHTQVLKNCVCPQAQALLAFFARGPEIAQDPQVQAAKKDLAAGGNIVFKMEGQFLHEIPEIRSAWEAWCAKQEKPPERQCLVTGCQAPVALLHPKIKGVKGAKAMGANLVSFNNESSCSYDLGEQGLNAPISEQAAFAYGAALNYLLRTSHQRILLGDSTLAYWAEGDAQEPIDIFAAGLGNVDNPDEVLREVMACLQAGKPIANVELDCPFYVLALSPNASRLSVRFFLRDTFGGMLTHLQAHYSRMRLIHPPFEPEYLTPNRLLSELTLDGNVSKANPLLSGALLRSIVAGTPYPQGLVNALVTRVKAEQKVNYARAAFLKAALAQKGIIKEELFVALNPTCTDTAYVLGRLFSVLEDLQQESAKPAQLNRTIKDSYFTSACATPGPIFARLMKLSQFHLNKLEGGSHVFYAKQIGQLCEMLPAQNLPVRLTLAEQSLFILGYYHQSQVKFNKAKEENNQ